MTAALALRYNDTDVMFDGETQMGSLTAMHKACDAPEHKRPVAWLRNKQTQELIAALESEVRFRTSADEGSDLTHDKVVRVVHGDNGGTWARYELALAYAQYLSPAFYIACNRFLWAVQTGQISVQPTTAPQAAQIVALEQRVAALEAARGAQRRLPAPKLCSEMVLAAIIAYAAPITLRPLYIALLPTSDNRLDELLRLLGRLQRHGLIEQTPDGYVAKASV